MDLRIKKQCGVALVVALLVVVIVTAIAVEITWRFDMSISRSSHRWSGMQSRSYGYAIEDAAKILLRFDITGGKPKTILGQDEQGQSGQESSEENSDDVDLSKIDTLEDDWNEELTFPTDEGYIKINIVDALSRFNLNSLANKPVQTSNVGNSSSEFSKRFSVPQRMFIRLLQTIPLSDDEENPVFLEESDAIALAEAVTDWIDTDNNVTGFGGAESDYYSSLEPPHVIANRPMISISELLIIQGMTPSLYNRLLDYVFVLPDKSITMNINTISEPLIRTINEKKNRQPLKQEDVELIVDERGTGWEDIGQFKMSSGIESLFPANSDGESEEDTDGLTVSSGYFIVNGEIAIGDKIKRVKSLLYRDGENITVLRRTDASF